MGTRERSERARRASVPPSGAARAIPAPPEASHSLSRKFDSPAPIQSFAFRALSCYNPISTAVQKETVLTQKRFYPMRGGVPERLNGTVSKIVMGSDPHPGFESLPLRLFELLIKSRTYIYLNSNF